MTEKAEGKFLLQLKQQFAGKNPVLLDTTKVYHELDQLAFDLGLIDMDDSVACKTSWWPLITILGGSTSGKSAFINEFFKKNFITDGIDDGSASFTALFHSDNEQVVTLPGTAVDSDPRFPFYHISNQIEQVAPGEGQFINNYLELKTSNCKSLDGKIIVSGPGLGTGTNKEVVPFLTRHLAEISDLVLVFFDADQKDLEEYRDALTDFISSSAGSSNPGKFAYIINRSHSSSSSVDLDDWKNRLASFGLQSGQFFIFEPAQQSVGFMSSAAGNRQNGLGQNSDRSTIGLKINHVTIDSAYRIVNSLERNIRDLNDVVLKEVKEGIRVWKYRSHFTLTLILSGFVVLLLLGEVNMGLLTMLFDPIIGPAVLLVLIVIMVPVYIFTSKQIAKWIKKDLDKRQKELGLIENLSALFQKDLTFWRILLPVKEPVGWSKEVQLRYQNLLDRPRELVQSLNDNFSTIGDKIGL